MNKLNRASLSFCLVFTLTASFVFANENTSKSTKRADQPLEIKIAPWGPTEEDVAAAKQRVERSAAVREKLKDVKYRLIGFKYIEENAADKKQPARPPTRYRVIFYDYTNDRAILAESDFAAKEPIKVSTELFDPGVGRTELDAAFALLRKDSAYSGLAEANKLEFFEPMPPVSNLKGERLVNIGVRNLATGESEIVGVSFKNDKVVHYENNAPPTARVAPETCGIADARQGSTNEGVPGQYQLSVILNGIPLWEMLVIRPSSSSGRAFERSGIEIRDVKYRGKSVLKRGHAPILTVKYINDFCGPFRDWQFAEGFFNAPTEGSTDPAPGIRVLGLGQIATTSLESGNDTGNFQGVAVYQQNVGAGNEVVLVTEMEAGWYRYIMEWRFAVDGVIRPRYGFGSVANACVCAPHTHHVYWRFDFDIVNPINKIFQIERGRKFLKPITNEAAIFRRYQTNRGFLIQNSSGNEAYQITPNLSDGSAGNTIGNLVDSFAAGDFWLLQFKGTADEPLEIDDPNPNSPDPDLSFRATIDPWLNNESLLNEDIVVWYGAHDFHKEENQAPLARPDVISGEHVVGPDLRPVRW